MVQDGHASLLVEPSEKGRVLCPLFEVVSNFEAEVGTPEKELQQGSLQAAKAVLALIEKQVVAVTQAHALEVGFEPAAVVLFFRTAPSAITLQPEALGWSVFAIIGVAAIPGIPRGFGELKNVGSLQLEEKPELPHGWACRIECSGELPGFE